MNVPQLTMVARSLLAVGFMSGTTVAVAQNTPAKSDNGIQEVIVTAQKVAQPASKTPLALSVISGDALKEAGVNDPRGLTEKMPNVEISQESGMLQIAIRGVASRDMTEKGDPSSAFHLDGAYIPRYEAQGAAFYDLERVEVLRGPQGTLYGRNATAGAINLITNKPGKTLAGRVGVEVGNYSTKRFDGMINVPINDMFSMRAAVNTNKHDSYLNQGPNKGRLDDQDDRSARIHLLADFTSNTSLLLTAETSKINGGGPTPVPITNFFTGTPVGTLPFTPPGRANNFQNPVYVDRGADAQRTAAWEFKQDAKAFRDNQADSLRGEFKTKLGAVDLTYQVAMMRLQIDQIANGVYFGFPLTNMVRGDSRSTSHELRLNSTGSGPLRWVVGAYHFDEDIERQADFTTYVKAPFGSFNVVVPYDNDFNNNSKAVFGQATYALREDTRLTLGARQTRDRKSGNDILAGAPAVSPATTSPNAYTADVKFSNTSWRVGLDHDLSKNIMAYASASTGYKAGGFNSEAGATVYKPENLKSYEAGVKGRFLENKLQMTASVFHYVYKDLQLSSTSCITNDPSTCSQRTTNAANSTVDGFEFEGKLKVGADGMLRTSVAFTDAKFKEYKPRPTIDFSGQHLDRAPTSTVGIGYTHHFPLSTGGEIIASADTRFSNSYLISDPDAGIRYSQPSYRKSDISVGYSSADGKWTAQLFAKNLENETKIESRVPGGFFVGDPRTFGLRAAYNF
jgi:iron complex outermembrane receptor protein